MTGRVLRINVTPGETVAEGAPLLILEAMKMENEIRAPRAGVVKEVAVAVGDRVNSGDTLVILEDA
jgi:biotin carboxyl carrier protein